jgi:sugar lactone lactonase YvrE
MQMLRRPLAVRPIGRAALWLPLLMGLGTPLVAQINYATPYTFTLFAGTAASKGSVDGTGSAALFAEPYGMAVDSTGNLYVADKNNDEIRMITPAGVVTTIAGSPGIVGTTDATGSAALFNGPACVAVASGGVIYVSDTGNNTIRKIASGGVVTTFAGTAGTSGSTNATGTAASFNQPYGLAVDGSGNVFVADAENNMIREITSAGVVTTFAGSVNTGTANGTGAAATFNLPVGIAIDGNGNLFVTDSGNNMIRKITSSGVVTTFAGAPGAAGYADGIGPAARFNDPRGISIDGNGNLFVADSTNNTIRKITSAGVVTTIAGAPNQFANQEGTGAAALFDVPVGTAVDGSGDVYVSSELGYIISKGDPATAVAPAVTQQPTPQTVATGSTVVFNVAADGLPAPTFQWYANGSALANGAGISGATGATLVVSGATAASVGTYYCVAKNASGSVQSSPAALAVVATNDVGRLVNISCRAEVGTGADILIAGFVVGGAGTSGSPTMLIRGSGPALVPFGVAGTLLDPHLQLFSGPTLLGSNAGWGGSAQIANAAAAVGAFAWSDSSSLDSALLQALSGGGYTAQVNGLSGDTGVALIEVYDTTPAGSYTPATPRIVNISARVQVGTGPNILIAGFAIGGSTSRTVLIRASGPALLPFGVGGILTDPELQLYSGSTLLGSNYAWGGNAEVSNAAAAVGAFAWSDSSSTDSAILVTLPPGTYTAQVFGAGGDSGVALIEVYEVP